MKKADCKRCNGKGSIVKGVKDFITGATILRTIPCPLCKPQGPVSPDAIIGRIKRATEEGIKNAGKNAVRKRKIIDAANKRRRRP